MPFYRLLYHAVWSTKNRQLWITDHVESIIRSSIESTCKEIDIQLHGVGVSSDHVHVVFAGTPTLELSKLIGRMKGGSSHAVNNSDSLEFSFQWQREYGLITLTVRSLPIVLDYPANQRSKHDKQQLISGLERFE